jgi:uncharacterized protein (TIGR02145 family)
MKKLLIISGMIILISAFFSCDKKSASVRKPFVVTAINNITQTTATFNAEVIDNGGEPVISSGVCWSLTADPTIENSYATVNASAGSYSGSINNLNPNTLYYFRAFATNSAGTGYGHTKAIQTLINKIEFNPELNYGSVKDIENNVYKTITIGTQTWMAENLRTTKYRNGDLTGSAWSYEDNDSISFLYGRVYNWYSVNDSRNLCPVGWHVPTHDEWTTLEEYLADNAYGYGEDRTMIAKSIASTTGWYSDETAGSIGNDQESNNSSGFTALPGGISGIGMEGFNFIGCGSYWWSATEENATLAWRGFYIWHGFSKVFEDPSDKQDGLSVRCLQDN